MNEQTKLEDLSKEELIEIIANMGNEKTVNESMINEITGQYLEKLKEVTTTKLYASQLEDMVKKYQAKEQAQEVSNQSIEPVEDQKD